MEHGDTTPEQATNVELLPQQAPAAYASAEPDLARSEVFSPSNIIQTEYVTWQNFN
jgi:hypothetical protein